LNSNNSTGHCLDHFLAEPFSEFHDPLLVTRWAEVPTFAGEGQRIVVATVLTSDTGKSIMRVTTIKPALARLTPF
jgi:hypothetical protein